MTTVVYFNGILYADRKLTVSCSDLHYPTEGNKIIALNTMVTYKGLRITHVAGAGDSGHINMVIQGLRDAKPAKSTELTTWGDEIANILDTRTQVILVLEDGSGVRVGANRKGYSYRGFKSMELSLICNHHPVGNDKAFLVIGTGEAHLTLHGADNALADIKRAVRLDKYSGYGIDTLHMGKRRKYPLTLTKKERAFLDETHPVHGSLEE